MSDRPNNDSPDSNDAPKTPLPVAVLGMAASCGIAVWAGVHYMTNDASLFYGLLAGLSFGATFAFGQQIKHRFMPPRPRKTDWRAQTSGNMTPAKMAALAARKINVEFDDEEIRTTVRGTRREGIAWRAVSDVTIRISSGPLPQPEWIIAGQTEDAIKGVLVPNDAEGLDQLQDAMKERLPGFDNDKTYETVVAAMSAMEGNFHVWKRPAA